MGRSTSSVSHHHPAPGPRAGRGKPRGARRSRWFSRLRRWGIRFETRWTPLGRALLLSLLFSGLFALNMRASLAYQLAALLFVAVLFARIGGALVRVPRDGELTLLRQLPGVVTEQTPFQYTVQVRNGGRRSWHHLELEDRPLPASPTLAQARLRPDPLDTTRPRFDQRVGYPRWLNHARSVEGIRPACGAVPPLPPASAAAVRLTVTPLRRGAITLGDARLRVTEPLGLVRRWRGVGNQAGIIALPSRFPVAWRSAWSSAPSASSGSSRRQRSPGGDFASLREYRPGDPLAHLSWRGLARYGVPVVKEFDEPVRARWQVVLDCGGAGGEGSGSGRPGSRGAVAQELASFDALVRVAASFAEHLVTAGMPVVLLQAGTATVAPRVQARLPAELVALHTTLALVERETGEPQPASSEDDAAASAATPSHRAFDVPVDECDAVWVLGRFDAVRQAAAAAKLRAGGNLVVLVVRPPGAAPLDGSVLANRPGCLIDVPEDNLAATLAAARPGTPQDTPDAPPGQPSASLGAALAAR